MTPRPTAVTPPIQLQIADDLRMKIERGDLRPGDPLPTLQHLCDQWSCSMNSARAAIALLKQQGLITGGRGRAPVVRTAPPRTCRSSERHQAEKDLVLKSEQERRQTGVAETDLAAPINSLNFEARYEIVNSDRDLASWLSIDVDNAVLRREYELTEKRGGHLRQWSVSYIPVALVESNPDLLDASNEPWPGGTQHQLYTVGIEIERMIDHVTARMPTTVEAQLWDLNDGVPILRVRRTSIDVDGRIVEVSDADFPADRTELSFTTPLKPWPKNQRRKVQ